jgi:uncharacterized protein YqhQ
MTETFNYGGQAVIEGVMMRGARTMALAVRDPGGNIVVEKDMLNQRIYSGPISKIPFLRGLVMLWDAMGLGIRSLITAADVAMDEDVSLNGPVGWTSALFGVLLGIGLFVLFPSALAGSFSTSLSSGWTNSFLEGLIRLLFLVAYVWLVSFMPDMKRVFAYHGAEHKTINAYEAGEELKVENVRRFPRLHARCGTSFLLTLVVFSILIFAPLNPPTLLWRLASRLVLLPVLTGLSYEFIRLAARHTDRPWVRLLVTPNLMLQRLTTSEPDDEMLEVSITALRTVLKDERRISASSP